MKRLSDKLAASVRKAQSDTAGAPPPTPRRQAAKPKAPAPAPTPSPAPPVAAAPRRFEFPDRVWPD